MAAHSLVARLRNGDPDAVERLYDEYGRRMFAVAYKALGDRSLAEEAVQLTFMKTWQAADRLEPDVEIGGWLYTITRRTAIDLYRRESRHATVGLDAEIVALPMTFEDLWQVWEVRSMIDRLPDGERAVVESLHFKRQTMQETADELGVPVGTVKSRTHRAYGRLAGLLRHLREETA
jgi:RNA polymerase sigma-70 factor (ECF subfamily)